MDDCANQADRLLKQTNFEVPLKSATACIYQIVADLIDGVEEGADVLPLEEIRRGLHHIRCMAGEILVMCISTSIRYLELW